MVTVHGRNNAHLLTRRDGTSASPFRRVWRLLPKIPVGLKIQVDRNCFEMPTNLKSESDSRVGEADHGVKTSRARASGRSWGRGRTVRCGVGRVRAVWQQLWAQPGATCPCAWPPACTPRWWMAAARTAEASGVTAPRRQLGVARLTSPAGRCGFAAGVGLRNCPRLYENSQSELYGDLI